MKTLEDFGGNTNRYIDYLCTVEGWDEDDAREMAYYEKYNK